MEKGLFKAGDKYRVCDNCGEWVPANQVRCDKCHEHISNFDFFTVEESQAASTGKLKCMICGTLTDVGHTVCPNCNNAALVPVEDEKDINADASFDEKKDTNADSFNNYNSDTESFSDAGIFGNTQFFDTADTQEESKYYFEGEILSGHGRKLQSKSRIAVTAEEIVVGRRYFIENRDLFFDGYTDELQQRFKVISTENAVICVKNGQITVRKCRNEASCIRIFRMNPDTGAMENGGEMEGTGEYTINPGDCLEFGNGDDHHRHILLQFGIEGAETVAKSVPKTAHRGITEDLNRIDRVLNLVLEGNKSINERMSSVEASIGNFEQIISKINFEELSIKKDESQEEYDRRIDKQVPVAQELTKDEEIRNFLKIRMKSGNTKDCSLQYEVVKDRDQIVEYLWQAAYFEKACNLRYESDDKIDYSIVINCIGRAFEEFICTFLLQTIYESQGDEFEAAMTKANFKLKSLAQGAICTYLLQYERVNNKTVYKLSLIHI